MSLLAFSINHNTAPVEIRERVNFAPEKMDQALTGLRACPDVNEAAILSTCNRTEIYCDIDNGNQDSLVKWFSQYHQIDEREIEPYVFVHPDQEAVRHILRVACGLDSMVLGEPQILGQLKDAYSIANKAGTLGIFLNRLFQYSFSVAKRIRTNTAIGGSPVSVAFAAVSLAKQIFSDMSNHTALLIGAGDTIELTARHLKENGIQRMIVANRTIERAGLLAEEFGAKAIALSEMPDHLAEADIVISSTASQLPILGKGTVERAIKQRKHRPIFMVDIAVPRDIEPEVGNMQDVYLYSVDDLKEIIDEGMKSRQEAARQAEEIIDTEVLHFMNWLQSLEAVSLVKNYRENAEAICQETLDKAKRKLANGENPEEVLEELANLLTNKLVHQPSVQMKQASYEGRHDLLEAARILLNIDND
ncbi:MAG: glutamyl-tRNA reductase [Gammaproteobacteria bacterium]|nr:glutamyl-tRNA reductase [Gammaproteobacteria bacterium]